MQCRNLNIGFDRESNRRAYGDKSGDFVLSPKSVIVVRASHKLGGGAGGSEDVDNDR